MQQHLNSDVRCFFRHVVKYLDLIIANLHEVGFDFSVLRSRRVHIFGNLLDLISGSLPPQLAVFSIFQFCAPREQTFAAHPVFSSTSQSPGGRRA
jgi:hypothetical protein